MNDEKPRRISVNSLTRIGHLDDMGHEIQDMSDAEIRQALERQGRRQDAKDAWSIYLDANMQPEPFMDAMQVHSDPVASHFGGTFRQHPFIIGLEVSAEGDIRYHGRDLKHRRSRRPIAGVAGDRAMPVLVHLQDPTPQLRDEGAGPDGPVPVRMQVVPVQVLIIETHDAALSRDRDAAAIRAKSWMWWILNLKSIDTPSTPLDQRPPSS